MSEARLDPCRPKMRRRRSARFEESVRGAHRSHYCAGWGASTSFRCATRASRAACRTRAAIASTRARNARPGARNALLSLAAGPSAPSCRATGTALPAVEDFMSIQAPPAPAFLVQRSNDRAYFDHGWLQTYHSFSFAEYRDPQNVNWGALRVFNDDVVAGGEGFPPHPHRDMEIVTYVLDGELAHRDSMGNHGVVGAGDVQFMSAGTGVTHSEFNNLADRPLHLVQMWVLPGALGRPPSYGQMEFAPGERRNRWLRIVSGEEHVEAPIRITQRATFAVARLEGGSRLCLRAQTLWFSLRCRRERGSQRRASRRRRRGSPLRRCGAERPRRRRTRSVGSAGGGAAMTDAPTCAHIEVLVD